MVDDRKRRRWRRRHVGLGGGVEGEGGETPKRGVAKMDERGFTTRQGREQKEPNAITYYVSSPLSPFLRVLPVVPAEVLIQLARRHHRTRRRRTHRRTGGLRSPREHARVARGLREAYLPRRAVVQVPRGTVGRAPRHGILVPHPAEGVVGLVVTRFVEVDVPPRCHGADAYGREVLGPRYPVRLAELQSVLAVAGVAFRERPAFVSGHQALVRLSRRAVLPRRAGGRRLRPGYAAEHVVPVGRARHAGRVGVGEFVLDTTTPSSTRTMMTMAVRG